MGRWEVVFFYKDNSIEAVPDTWIKKDLCAWPKSSKNIKKLIKNRHKPNKADFFYYPARILGTKNYATLAEAQAKLSKATTNSDLSTTEDEVKKVKKKTFNPSAGLVDKHFPPPMYKDYCSKVTKSKHNVESIFHVDNLESLSDNNDDNIADDNDDSDCDPTWGNGRIISDKGSDLSNSEENIMIQSTSDAIFSPNTQVWKVNHLNRYEPTEMAPNFQRVHKSPGKWNISTSSTNNQSEDVEALKHVKKTLDAHSKNVNDGSNHSNSEENIMIQSTSEEYAIFSPNTQVWKVNHLNRYEPTEMAPNFQRVHKSPGKRNISTSSTNNQSEDALKHVKKTLVLDVYNKNVNDGNVITSKSKSGDNLHSSINPDGGVFMSSHDFQKFTFTSLTHLKYDMSAMLHIIKDTNEKLQVLMAQSNNNFISTISPKQNSIDMNIFPLTSDDELMELENKIDDTHYRDELICKLSLLVDNNNLNTSVRRIISRLCDDALLVSYSLTGFKHNKPFGSLKIYRVILDAVRLNLQYAEIPDKKIDVPLRVWLDHAKFRIKEKNEKKNKDIQLIN